MLLFLLKSYNSCRLVQFLLHHAHESWKSASPISVEILHRPRSRKTSWQVFSLRYATVCLLFRYSLHSLQKLQRNRDYTIKRGLIKVIKNPYSYTKFLHFRSQHQEEFLLEQEFIKSSLVKALKRQRRRFYVAFRKCQTSFDTFFFNLRKESCNSFITKW